MASSTTEASPLLPKPPRRQRTVTFNPTVSHGGPASETPADQLAVAPTPSTSAGPGGQPVLSALNNRLRRRHSHGAPLQQFPSIPKTGAQRTTKHAQKLKLLPDPDHGEDGPDEESGRDVYSQFTRIKDPMARRDAARLGKDDREKLPRVTAYCTANAYRLEDLMKYFKSRGKAKGAQPKLFDECLYTPYYSYKKPQEADSDDFVPESHATAFRTRAHRRFSDSVVEVDETADERRQDLIDIEGDGRRASIPGHDVLDSSGGAVDSDSERSKAPAPNPDFDTQVHTPEVFLFNYGTVVIWGMSLQEEERFLKEIAKFENEKLSKDDVQAENFNFYYTREYQARIYNDFISLREKRNYMTKLAISHALSQSVKTSLYEDLVDNSIEETKDIPAQLATHGKTGLSRKQIAVQTGELFILRINIHLQGSVLDSPELMWAEPGLEPIYAAVRGYLELEARCALLNERLNVIGDLLAVLKDQSSHRHGEFLEWIVIILVAAEITVAAINILVDVFAGID